MYVDKLLVLIQVNTKGIDKARKEIEQTISFTDKFKNLLRSLQPLLLGMGMSLLFTGMAIKRYTENAIRSLLMTYMTIAGETNNVTDSINELQAYLLFLKYDLMDVAESSGLFDEWVNRIRSVFDWFNNLSEGTKKSIMNVLAWGSVVGTIMMIVGMALLFLLGPLALIDFIFGRLANINWTRFLRGLGIILVVVGLIYALIKIWNSDMSKTSKIIYTIAAVLMAVGLIIFMLVGWWGLIIVAIGVVLALVWRFRYDMILAFLYIGKAIQDYFISKLNEAIDFVNKIMRLLYKLRGKTWIDISYVKGPINFEGAISKYERKKREVEAKEGQFSVAKQFVSGGPTGMLTGFLGEEMGNGHFIKNIINIHGDVYDENMVDKIAEKVKESSNFENGTPQT